MLTLLARRAMWGMLDAVEHIKQRSLCMTDHVTVVQQLELVRQLNVSPCNSTVAH
jgi:hypothetical protein